ncbi:autophagy-related protein 11-like, partial [Gastrolobium bilobum]|uniref:autophagy-related protein 11-like n=1 Tax=Gastrolobium bilobum TaxID=150636 RepID=UPI002AB30F58
LGIADGQEEEGTTGVGKQVHLEWCRKKEKCSNDIEDELRRLKGECEKVALEKSSEVSSLLAENTFVWNQYNLMEKDYTNKLRSKQAEVEKAKEKITILVSSMELLQSENNKKDSTVSQLQSKVADMEAETKRLNKEISGLSVELESLRKFRNNQVTPVLNHCTEGTKASESGIITSSEKPEEERSPSYSPSETPKLFSSSFKVPKLKPSLRVRSQFF